MVWNQIGTKVYRCSRDVFLEVSLVLSFNEPCFMARPGKKKTLRTIAHSTKAALWIILTLDHELCGGQFHMTNLNGLSIYYYAIKSSNCLEASKKFLLSGVKWQFSFPRFRLTLKYYKADVIPICLACFLFVSIFYGRLRKKTRCLIKWSGRNFSDPNRSGCPSKLHSTKPTAEGPTHSIGLSFVCSCV